MSDEITRLREGPSDKDQIKILQFKIELMGQDNKTLKDSLEAAERERDLLESKLAAQFRCCGGNDENPPEHTMDCPDQKNLEALRERLESAECGDIWVAFTPDGMPREVTRQDFEPHINPRIGRWVRCIQSAKLGGRDVQSD